MEHGHYADLLVRMYDFPKSCKTQIASVLSHEHIDAIDAAVADLLQVKASGDRMYSAVVRFCGICDWHKTNLQVIGSEFDPPVTRSYVGELRRRAARLLMKNSTLQPVAQHLHDNGFTNDLIDRTRQLLTAEQLQQLSQIALITDRQEKIAALRELNVQSLGLSDPTANCLRNTGIQNVAELCNYSKAELLHEPNFGRKSLNEVEAFLASLNEHLKSE